MTNKRSNTCPDFGSAPQKRARQWTGAEENNAVRLGHTGGRWSAAEDQILKHAVDKYGAKNWKSISELAFRGSRTDVQCLHRWQKVLKPGLVKGPWTGEEDETVRSMVLSHGLSNIKWSLVATKLPGRLGKQARERWYNHLDPTLKKEPWAAEEDAKLMELQKQLGNRWCKIAKFIPGRSENAVKNRWNSAMRKRKLASPGARARAAHRARAKAADRRHAAALTAQAAAAAAAAATAAAAALSAGEQGGEGIDASSHPVAGRRRGGVSAAAAAAAAAVAACMPPPAAIGRRTGLGGKHAAGTGAAGGGGAGAGAGSSSGGGRSRAAQRMSSRESKRRLAQLAALSAELARDPSQPAPLPLFMMPETARLSLGSGHCRGLGLSLSRTFAGAPQPAAAAAAAAATPASAAAVTSPGSERGCIVGGGGGGSSSNSSENGGSDSEGGGGSSAGGHSPVMGPLGSAAASLLAATAQPLMVPLGAAAAQLRSSSSALLRDSYALSPSAASDGGSGSGDLGHSSSSSQPTPWRPHSQQRPVFPHHHHLLTSTLSPTRATTAVAAAVAGACGTEVSQATLQQPQPQQPSAVMVPPLFTEAMPDSLCHSLLLHRSSSSSGGVASVGVGGGGAGEVLHDLSPASFLAPRPQRST